MAGKSFKATTVDKHIGKRVQLRRIMMGMSQKDLAKICGITSQQIQKYENAGNRIPASRLFKLSIALGISVEFFFSGLPGNIPPETRTTRSARISSPQENDPLAKNETLALINLYWKLPNQNQRKMITKIMRSFIGKNTKTPLGTLI